MHFNLGNLYNEHSEKSKFSFLVWEKLKKVLNKQDTGVNTWNAAVVTLTTYYILTLFLIGKENDKNRNSEKSTLKYENYVDWYFSITDQSNC